MFVAPRVHTSIVELGPWLAFRGEPFVLALVASPLTLGVNVRPVVTSISSALMYIDSNEFVDKAVIFIWLLRLYVCLKLLFLLIL